MDQWSCLVRWILTKPSASSVLVSFHDRIRHTCRNPNHSLPMHEPSLAGGFEAGYRCSKRRRPYFRLHMPPSQERTDLEYCLCPCGKADSRTCRLPCVFATLRMITYLANRRIRRLTLAIGSGGGTQIGKMHCTCQSSRVTSCASAPLRNIFPYSSCRPQRLPMYDAIPT